MATAEVFSEYRRAGTVARIDRDGSVTIGAEYSSGQPYLGFQCPPPPLRLLSALDRLLQQDLARSG